MRPLGTLVWTPGGPDAVPSVPGHYQLRGVLLRRGAEVRSRAVPVQVTRGN